MYTPLRFMNQIQGLFKVPGVPRHVNEFVNKRFKSFVNSSCADGYDLTAMCLSHLWYYGSNMPVYPIEPHANSGYELSIFNQMVVDYASKLAVMAKRTVGIQCAPDADFAEAFMQFALYNMWTVNKRVYSIDNGIIEALAHTRLPKDWSYDVFCNLPCKTFYIDYQGRGDMFCEGLCGTFVQSAYDEDIKMGVWHFTHIFDRPDKVGIVHTMVTHAKESGFKSILKCLDSFGEAVPCALDDKNETKLSFNDKLFLQFFINFVIYINTQKTDVEYTERTKSVYKPVKKGSAPKNKISEIEEFGVGVKYCSTISANKKRVKYINKPGEENPDEPREKRPYSSNWRSGHWHSYHAKDESGKDTIVIHWIPETFVHGNRENQPSAIKVTKVKK